VLGNIDVNDFERAQIVGEGKNVGHEKLLHLPHHQTIKACLCGLITIFCS